MLLLRRKVNESITIPTALGTIVVTVLKYACGAVSLGIDAPRAIEVSRTEILKAPQYESNALARLEGSAAWTDYGPVSLHEAARLEAIKTGSCTWNAIPEYEWLIEARRENDTQVLTVRVKTSIAAEVIDL